MQCRSPLRVDAIARFSTPYRTDCGDVAVAEELADSGAQLHPMGDTDPQRQLICADITMGQVKLAQQPRFELVHDAITIGPAAVTGSSMIRVDIGRDTQRACGSARGRRARPSHSGTVVAGLACSSVVVLAVAVLFAMACAPATSRRSANTSASVGQNHGRPWLMNARMADHRATRRDHPCPLLRDGLAAVDCAQQRATDRAIRVRVSTGPHRRNDSILQRRRMQQLKQRVLQSHQHPALLTHVAGGGPVGSRLHNVHDLWLGAVTTRP